MGSRARGKSEFSMRFFAWRTEVAPSVRPAIASWKRKMPAMRMCRKSSGREPDRMMVNTR
jgi:hypothetical protein